MKKDVSYTVRATQREDARSADGSVMQAKGTTIFLDWTNEGGGWPQWSTRLPSSTPFETEAKALETAKRNDGMPWWNLPDMEHLTVLRLTHSSHFEVEEI